VGHLVSSQGISFTEAKRLKVLDFPRPLTEKQLLMFIGLVNYFRDHVPHMTELMKPLRDMHNPKSYKPSAKLLWSPEHITAFETCHRAVSNCQELYFLEDDDVPIHVIRFFSKALTGAQLNWHSREKECYGIFYGVELFEAE